jgi:hypothetical protein
MLVGVDERAMDRGQGEGQCRRSLSGELHTVDGLGDPGRTTSDHRVRAMGITSHGDGVVDWWPV